MDRQLETKSYKASNSPRQSQPSGGKDGEHDSVSAGGICMSDTTSHDADDSDEDEDTGIHSPWRFAQGEMGCNSPPTSTSGNNSHPGTLVLPILCDNGK